MILPSYVRIIMKPWQGYLCVTTRIQWSVIRFLFFRGSGDFLDFLLVGLGIFWLQDATCANKSSARGKEGSVKVGKNISISEICRWKRLEWSTVINFKNMFFPRHFGIKLFPLTKGVTSLPMIYTIQNRNQSEDTSTIGCSEPSHGRTSGKWMQMPWATVWH